MDVKKQRVKTFHQMKKEMDEKRRQKFNSDAEKIVEKNSKLQKESKK